MTVLAAPIMDGFRPLRGGGRASWIGIGSWPSISSTCQRGAKRSSSVIRYARFGRAVDRDRIVVPEGYHVAELVSGPPWESLPR